MDKLRELLKSRRLAVTAVVGILIFALAEKVGVKLDEATASAIQTALVLFIFGESGAASGTTWKELFSNPKFIVFAAAVANALLRDRLKLPISADLVQHALSLVQLLLATYAYRPLTPTPPPTPLPPAPPETK